MASVPAQPKSLGSAALASAASQCPVPGAVVASVECVEELALEAGASIAWGAPRGFLSEVAAVLSVEDMVAELEVALALDVEPGVDLVLVVQLVVALGSVVELASLVAMGVLASLCAPLEASKRSQSTRVSSLL